jgi:hypothetical protein
LEDIHTSVSLEQLPKTIESEKEKLWEMERNQLIANLHIDKEIKLKYVIDFRSALRKSGLMAIQYSTALKDSNYPSYYPGFKYYGLRYNTHFYFSQLESFLDSAEKLDFTKYRIKLRESFMYRNYYAKTLNHVRLSVSDKQILLNGSEFDDNTLRKYLTKLFVKFSPNFVIIYDPDDEISYGRYIQYLDLMYSVIDDLRNQMSIEIYDKKYDYWLFDHEKDIIDRRYPRNIFDMTKEEKRLDKLIKIAGNKRQ